MAHAVAVDEWEAGGVRLTDVSNALSELRHRSREGGSARTAVMTFIAVAPDDEHARGASSALRALGANHPSRIVIFRPHPDAVATLDARATLFNVDQAGHEVNFEEISLNVCGQAANHLDSLADAFTISDLPVPVWYVGTIPDVTDALLDVATAVLVDSRDAAGAERLRSLMELSRRLPVVDLSWTRLKPWRVLTAALFSEPTTRPWLNRIESLVVEGKEGPRHMLAGWAMAQLGLDATRVTLRDARHVRITIECADGDRKATFTVGRSGDDRVLEATTVLPDGPCAPRHLRLADDPLAASVAEALVHLEPDAVWQRALAFATRLES